MNHKFSKLFAFLLSLALLISLLPMGAVTAFAAENDEITTVAEGNVAKVGNTEYATIDEAIAAWTNGTTLTLLSDVTLTDVIKLSSTEYHVLDLGTYTMTAASRKDAIQIVNNGRTSASYALDIKADAENPGGITASGKTVVVTTGKSGVQDRPIIRFYNGVFNASNVVKHSGSNGTKCPQFQFHGGVFNGTISTNRALNQFYGGTFTGSLMMSVDSSAYTLIAGGTFKNLSNLYMSALNSDKFTIGSAKGVYDKEVYIDDNGNYVIAAAEPAQGIEAAVAMTLNSNNYFTYSKVATEGMKYTDATMALQKNNTSSAKVTIYAEELDLAGIDYKGTIVAPEGKTLKITNAPEGLKVEGNVVVVKPVAKIDETSYNSLSDAIADATAGQTITFLADITEDVTINKALTIEGAGKTYTGAMELKADTTIKNVNFDGKGYNGYAITTRGASYLTIEKCTAKNYGYGFVQLASATALTTVKNVTVSDVNYGVKVDYSTAVVLENVDFTAGVAAVLNSNYGGKTITIKNSKLNILGTWTRNNTTKTNYVFEGANTIDSFIIDAAIDTFKLAAGATLTAPNDITVTTVEDYEVKYENGKYLAVEAGLAGSGTETDPYQIRSVKDLIKFRNSVNAGETKYNAKGVYVALTADIDLEGINWVGIGSATAEHGFMGNFDGNGHKIQNLTITDPALDSDGYAYAGLFSVTEGTDKNNQNIIKNLIIENVTISTTGHIVSAAIAYPYYTIVENVTVCGDINITGGDYTAGALAYTRRCVNASDVTVSGNAGSTITGRHTVGGVISDIQMNGGLTAVYSNFAISGVKITGEKSVGGISGIIANQKLNGATVKNVELVSSDARVGTVSGSLGGTSTITNVVIENVTGADSMIGATYDHAAEVAAQIGNTYYATFDAAMKAAKEGDTITLFAPIVVAKDETVVIDLKGATIVGAPTEAKAYAVITNYGNLTIEDSVGGGAIICDHKLAGSTGYAVNTIVNSGTLTIEGGIIENKSTASNQIGYAIDNNSTSYDAVVVIKGGEVKASGSNYYDAIRLFCNNLNKENSVTVEGGKVSSIWLQNPSDGATKDTKDVKGSVTITGGTVDALYLEPSSAFEAAISGGYVGKVEYFTTSAGRDLAGFITGGTFGTDVTKFVADGLVVKKNADGSYGIVKTTVTIGSVEDLLAFANAVTGNKEYQGVKVAANSKAVVVLTADLDLAGSGFVGIGNGAANAFSGTFDGQGHTISNMTLSCNYYRGVGFFRSLGKGAVVKNVTFVNANVNNGAATSANHFYGVVAGFSEGLTLDNVDVKNSTVTCKYSGAAMVGCLQGSTVIKNTDIENVTLTTTDIRAAAYGIIGNSASGHSITTENNTVNGAKLVINGETKPLAETVAYGSWNAGQDYAESTYVAQIGEKKYSTLTAAIKAAQAGDTITMIGDVNGNVTIDKNLTIDGNGKTYTGTMTANDNLTVTVQNVNFVNGGIAKATKSAKGNYTIKGCTFDGEGKYAYALSFKGANKITVEDCTVSNYMYGFLYVSSSTINVSVKDVTVENCPSYAVYFGSGVNTASFENLTVKNSNNGFVLNNTANRAFTVKGCTMENVGTAINHSKGTNTITCTALGVNDFGAAALSQYANVVGVQVGTKFCGSLADAFAAAQDGDTIKLLSNIATSETITIADGKKITLDMNGKKITATDNKAANASYELFYIYGELAVTGNGTIELTSTSNDTAWAKSSTIFHNRGGILTIENGTFTHNGGTCMAYVVDNSGNWYGDATTVINGGTLTSTYTAIRNRMEQNTHGASGKAILVINGGTIDGTTSAIWAQAASISTVAPATGSITVNGGNIGLINTARSNGAECMTTIKGGTVASFKGETGELTVNGGKITGTITICHDNGDVAKYKVKKDGVYYAAVAKVGTTYYATLQEAIDACSVGGKVTLVDNAKGPGVVINKDITINFSGNTYTLTEGVGSTGTESNGFQILAGNKVTLSAGTLKVAEEAAGKFYILVQNYADLSCFNMNLDGTYLDKWSKTDGDSYVLSNNSGYISLTGKTYITTNNDGDKAFAFDACDSKYYADKPVVFAASTVKINGKAISESYGKIEAAARIGSTQFFASLKEAFAYASSGNTIKLMADVAVSEGITNTKKVTLDLNGKTITGTDNATGSFAIITNKGQLTITGNGKITLTATNNRGWNAYSSVISNTVGGKLIVESGTIEHLGGTDMAYGIDNLTNGKGTYAETIINGGTIKSTYRAIRMFLNGVEAQNILTVNGGVIEGANKSIWMQDPSKNANTGNLTVTKGATLNGDVYLTVTAGSTQWPVEVSIAASAVNGEVLTSNVPAGYKLVQTKGVYSVEKVKVYIAQVGVTKYESLQAAIDACPAGGKVTLLRDAKGPGVVINKNITILFNGHTYTITEPVGSAGTETLGFQILKGNKVVLNNGKIEIAEEAADKFAILIQNYADLTVYQMTLDGTNLGRYENYSYVLSVNCGKVTVNGKSVLTAKDGEGNYALDVYDYSSAGYSLPTVTVTSVVKINGKISAGAKYSTVYYATVEQAKAANPGKNVTVLN